MMITIKEIHEIRDNLEDFYSGLRNEQRIDEEYYTDTFPTPLIQQPNHVVRSGRAAHLTDSPAEHITTSNPQVFTEPVRKTETARATAIKQARFYNHLLSFYKLASQDTVKEFVKNQLRRGEGFYQLLYNENWDKSSRVLPVLPKVIEPMIIWPHPSETNCIPECVILKYKRKAWTIEKRWPEWNGKGEVEWLEYWDKDWRYFEAGGKPVLKEGIEPNIHGVVPFVHAYSGFGKSSPDGKPESLAVSIIKLARSLLLEECQVRSLIDSIVHLYTHPEVDIYAESIQAEGALKNFDYTVIPGEINLIPAGIRIIKDRGTPPSSELFHHLAEIEERLDRFLPPVLQGIATDSGESGRSLDIRGRHSEYKYDTVIENAEKALSVALDLSRQIMLNIPGMLPVTVNSTVVKNHERSSESETLKKADLEDACRITVKLAAANPIESDRQALLHRTLYKDGIEDWRTCLIEGMGKTAEEAEDIINQTIADKAVLEQMMAFIAQRSMEKMGMVPAGAGMPTSPPTSPPTGLTGPQGGEPRNLNLQTQQGFNMADLALTQGGMRNPPGV